MGVDELPSIFQYHITAQSECSRTTYEIKKGAKAIIGAEEMNQYVIKLNSFQFGKFLEKGHITTKGTAQKKIVDTYVELEGRFLFVRCKDDILRGNQHGRIFTSTYQFSERKQDNPDKEEYEIRVFNQEQARLEARINDREYREYLPLSPVIELIRSAEGKVVTEKIKGIPITIFFRGPLLLYADFGDSVLPEILTRH